MKIKKIYKDKIQGGEFDWFAIDRDGDIAIFSTAGKGNVPNKVIESYKNYENISNQFELPNWGSSDIWHDYAKLGFYAYDWDLHYGFYKRECVPTQSMDNDLKSKILPMNTLTELKILFKEENDLIFDFTGTQIEIKKINYVDCCEHGRQQETFVCQHIVESLKNNKPYGFWWSIEDPDNLRPDAWCSRCEDIVNKNGGWEGEAEKFANVKILCGICYDKAKLINFPIRKPWWKFW